jgi:hypothetical protein
MATTQPRGKQLRFILNKADGSEVTYTIDQYLEDAALGDKTLKELLEQLYDTSGDMKFSLRYDNSGSVDKLQFQAGSSTTAWTDITSFFNQRGTFSSSEAYRDFDMVVTANKDVYLVHDLTTDTQTYANESAFTTASTTSRIVHVSEARDWAIKTTGTVDGTDYSAKYWATTGNVVTVSSNISDINAVADDIDNVNTVASNISTISEKLSLSGGTMTGRLIIDNNGGGTDILLKDTSDIIFGTDSEIFVEYNPTLDALRFGRQTGKANNGYWFGENDNATRYFQIKPDEIISEEPLNFVANAEIKTGLDTLTLNPNAHGSSNTGTVVIAGNLQVDGTTTTINSTTVEIDDLAIVVAADATTSTEANNAGLIIAPSGPNASILWDNSSTRLETSHALHVNGNISVTGLVDGANISAMNTKLFYIDDSADVTTYSTVQAAGALMDDELTDIGAVKTLNQSLTTTSNATFADVIVDHLQADTLTVDTDTLHVDAVNNRVGIGTATPQSALHVDTGATGQITLEDSAYPRNNYIGVENSDNLVLAADEDNAGSDSEIKFRVDAAERMSLSSNALELNNGVDIKLHSTLAGSTLDTLLFLSRDKPSAAAAWDWLTAIDFYGDSTTTSSKLYASLRSRIGSSTANGMLDIYLLDGGSSTQAFGFRGNEFNLYNDQHIRWTNLGTGYTGNALTLAPPSSISSNITITLPATAGTLLSVASDGTNGQMLTTDGSANYSFTDVPETYSLPIAADATLGGIKVGTGLAINASTGVLDVALAELSSQNPTFNDLTLTDDLTVGDDISLGHSIYHKGDANTYIAFDTDVIKFFTGGYERLYLSNTSFIIDYAYSLPTTAGTAGQVLTQMAGSQTIKSIQWADVVSSVNGSTGDVTIDAGMPTSGGTFSGDVTFNDNVYAKFGNGTGGDVKIGHNGNGLINNYTNDLYIQNYANDRDVIITSDNGSGGTLTYFRADGSDGGTMLYHYGTEKIKTTTNGVDISGYADVDNGMRHNGNLTNEILFGSNTQTFKTYGSDRIHITNTGVSIYPNLYANGDIILTDTNTKIVRVSSGNMAFYSAGGERFRVNSDGVKVNGGLTETEYSISFTSSGGGFIHTLDASNGAIQYGTLAGATTFSESLSNGESILLLLNDGTAYTITWPTMTWLNNAGSAPTLATSGYTAVVIWQTNNVVYGALVADGT